MMKYVAPQDDGIPSVGLPGLHEVQEVPDLQGHVLAPMEVVNVPIQQLDPLILTEDDHEANQGEP